MGKKQYVLVTGGAGYIGSHACKAFAEAGYTPVAYDNLENGHEWAVQWGPLEVGDIVDRERLDYVMDRYQPGAVIHFAGYAYVGESVGNPGKYYRNNVAGTLNLLESTCDHDIKQFIFSSSCTVYGVPQQQLISESHRKQPINPYGFSKAMVEQMLQDFDRAHGIRSISLRYFNASGADMDGGIGEIHDPETHLIPLVLDVSMGKSPFFTIFGDDYDTLDGTCIRDFIHVTDLAQAHVLALNALEAGNNTTAYNLGNGKGFSVREVISITEEITGAKLDVRVGPRRAGDPGCLVADATKAINQLGWKPHYTKLSEIIESAWLWQNKQ